jgi:hypothetical protein
MRWSRQRKRRGLKCYTIDVRDSEIETLVRDCYLQAERRGNKAAVVNALHAFLDQNLK